MSKKPISTLKTYFETGDKPTEEQFSHLIDSFFHKDSGILPVSSSYDSGTGVFTINFSDSSEVTFTVPQGFDISEIVGLQAALDDKVDKVTGKELSTNDYDNTEKAQVASNKSHSEDTDIHVTTTDKANWNAKAETGEYDAALTVIEDDVDTVEEIADNNAQKVEALSGKVAYGSFKYVNDAALLNNLSNIDTILSGESANLVLLVTPEGEYYIAQKVSALDESLENCKIKIINKDSTLGWLVSEINSTEEGNSTATWKVTDILNGDLSSSELVDGLTYGFMFFRKTSGGGGVEGYSVTGTRDDGNLQITIGNPGSGAVIVFSDYGAPTDGGSIKMDIDGNGLEILDGGGVKINGGLTLSLPSLLFETYGFMDHTTLPAGSFPYAIIRSADDDLLYFSDGTSWLPIVNPSSGLAQTSGTFTPTIAGLTFTVRNAVYVKTGNWCHVELDLANVAGTTTDTGINIEGIPSFDFGASKYLPVNIGSFAGCSVSFYSVYGRMQEVSGDNVIRFVFQNALDGNVTSSFSSGTTFTAGEISISFGFYTTD